MHNSFKKKHELRNCYKDVLIPHLKVNLEDSKTGGQKGIELRSLCLCNTTVKFCLHELCNKSRENISVFQDSLGTDCDKLTSRNNLHIGKSSFLIPVEFRCSLKIGENKTHPI